MSPAKRSSTNHRFCSAFAFAVSLAGCASNAPGSDAAADGASGPLRFQVRIDNISPWTSTQSGAVSLRSTGGYGPLLPGEFSEWTFDAPPDTAMSFVAMFGESNDWFFAPGPAGIQLYNTDGSPRSGDVTSQIRLWNAGTEVDQEPAVGPNTGTNQPSPSSGDVDPTPSVRALGEIVTLTNGTTFRLPPVAQMISATLVSTGPHSFRLRLQNVSNPNTLSTSRGFRDVHVSPAVWTVHRARAPFFEPDTSVRLNGLEPLAEAGDTTVLEAELSSRTGPSSALSPGVFLVHESGSPLFSVGQPLAPAPLELLVEAGDPSALAQLWQPSPPAGTSAFGTYTMPVASATASAVMPGASYRFEFVARPGQRLSFLTSLRASNDWFIATPASGLELFDSLGHARVGDRSDELGLYDAGTEADQAWGVGADTVALQTSATQGAADPMNTVRALPPSATIRAASAFARVTLRVVP